MISLNMNLISLLYFFLKIDFFCVGCVCTYIERNTKGRRKKKRETDEKEILK